MSKTKLRRGDRRAIWMACCLMMMLPVAAYFSASAKADPVDRYAAEKADSICKVLDAFPTYAGIGGIADAIVQQTNLTYRDAGSAIGTAVITVCPRHIGLLKDFAATYAQTSQVTRVGGGIR